MSQPLDMGDVPKGSTGPILGCRDRCRGTLRQDTPPQHPPAMMHLCPTTDGVPQLVRPPPVEPGGQGEGHTPGDTHTHPPRQ